MKGVYRKPGSRDLFRAGKRLWSAVDDAALRRIFPDVRTSIVARQLGRTYAATCGRAAFLGLHKSAAYLASPAACRLRRSGDEHPGRATQFQKGHVSHNKGLRRPGWSVGRMTETQFKAGQLNGVAARRFKPIGSTRIVEGYVYRKISAVPGPWTRNWKPEHVLIWTQAHGPLPAGHVLAFHNGDRLDVRLDNLELITRRALMARNSVHTLPEPLAKAVLVLAALTRQIRRRTKHGEQDRRSA